MNAFTLETVDDATLVSEAKRRREQAKIAKRMNTYQTDHKTAVEFDNAQFNLPESPPTDLFGHAAICKVAI